MLHILSVSLDVLLWCISGVVGTALVLDGTKPRQEDRAETLTGVGILLVLMLRMSLILH